MSISLLSTPSLLTPLQSRPTLPIFKSSTLASKTIMPRLRSLTSILDIPFAQGHVHSAHFTVLISPCTHINLNLMLISIPSTYARQRSFRLSRIVFGPLTMSLSQMPNYSVFGSFMLGPVSACSCLFLLACTHILLVCIYNLLSYTRLCLFMPVLVTASSCFPLRVLICLHMSTIVLVRVHSFWLI